MTTWEHETLNEKKNWTENKMKQQQYRMKKTKTMCCFDFIWLLLHCWGIQTEPIEDTKNTDNNNKRAANEKKIAEIRRIARVW